MAQRQHGIATTCQEQPACVRFWLVVQGQVAELEALIGSMKSAEQELRVDLGKAQEQLQVASASAAGDENRMAALQAQIADSQAGHRAVAELEAKLLGLEGEQGVRQVVCFRHISGGAARVRGDARCRCSSRKDSISADEGYRGPYRTAPRAQPLWDATACVPYLMPLHMLGRRM